MIVQSSFKKYVMAVDRVEQLLIKLTQSLNAGDHDYAIIGGNAVAVWVASVDESAVRATKDVDLLIRRDDLEKITHSVRSVDLVATEVHGVHMFLDEINPNPKTGVQLVFAGERVMEHYAHAAPDPSQSVESQDGFRLIELAKLVEMKLQAYRFIDRVHIQDLLYVGLINPSIRDALPADLLTRLEEIEAAEKE